MKRPSEKGFSIFELLIVMALMSVIAAMGIGYYFNYQRQTMLKSSLERVNAFLYSIQQKSIGQEGSSQWGVHFENPSGAGLPFYASFKGSSYSTAEQTVYLDGALDFAFPADGTSVDIVFDRITGKVTGGVYKKVYVILKPGVAVKAVNVSPIGVITMNDGEIGWWKMDEGVGATTADSSGYGNIGTINGGMVFGDDSRGQGKVLVFDGANDYVITPNIAISQSMTWSVWYKATTPQNEFLIDHRSGGIGVQPIYAYNTGKIQFYDSTNGSLETATGIFKFDGNWHNVVVVGNATSRAVYYDGARVATVATGLTPQAGRSVYIGTRYSLASYFNGTMDDLRIYDRSLSADEIKKLYQESR
ncbi:MAG: prepilin-type N-terminal cleavage/methylation domain-containing protein [Candidatus Colwellbacteria bacterium]|nr:prepilin-type N-terminal cleavage/methylation domain-containing protein [Candidatus Colwellbacteria bacterium]